MCALQIEAVLTDAGFDEEFIAGVIGNVKSEGVFGLFEGVNKDGRLRGEVNEYWVHMMDCIDYFNVYNKKNLVDVNLLRFYDDFICKKNSGECMDSENHKMGIGAVQWTQEGRFKRLMGFYLEQAGYDMSSEQFSEFMEEWRNKEEKDEVYLKKEQIRDAEINMIIYELTSQDKGNRYWRVYDDYSRDRGDDDQEALWNATKTVMKDYEGLTNGNIEKRFAAAKRWYGSSSEQ